MKTRIELETLEKDLRAEIKRTKDNINNLGYDNYSALSNIVRDYRKTLKSYLKIVIDDIREMDEKY